MQANWGGIAAVAVLYAVFLTVGFVASRRIKSNLTTDLLVAGRNMPFWMAALTLAATWIDGGYLLGTAEGAFNSLASSWQGGVCFGLSLILGGLVFAGRMRRLQFVTLIDPFAARFGKRWAAVLAVPAMMGEVFWSAELLVAIGTTFGVILGVKLVTAIIISAAVVTLYTAWGGMWSVGYTDAVQFALIPLGLLIILPLALAASGGFEACWTAYREMMGERASLVPPTAAAGYWTPPRIVGWWDLSLMLVLGGIPWNCYFQRIQSCRTPQGARWTSVAAGAITMALTVPPLLMGMAALTYRGWSSEAAAELHETPAMALPLLLGQALPPWAGILGLTAIVGAVTSSFSASILSAGSMIGWNVVGGLAHDRPSERALSTVVRVSTLALGALAAVMALRVQSVQQLWFFTSDLIFVLLFPQLLYALFDPRANRSGSVVGFVASLVIRLGDGEPILGVPRLISYDSLLAWVWPSAGGWLDPEGDAKLFPVRTCAALAGLLLIPIVSRLTARRDPPRPLTVLV